jgi:hypothetical protein
MNKKMVKISVILAARCPAKIAVFVDDYKKERFCNMFSF